MAKSKIMLQHLFQWPVPEFCWERVTKPACQRKSWIKTDCRDDKIKR